MTDLLDNVVEAHGGLKRWNELGTVSAHLIQGGVLWAAKGQQGVLDDVFVTASLHEERESHHPFGAADRRSVFTPERVAIETSDGTVVEALQQPRASFAGHTIETPSTTLQLAYFVGTAMWTYLTQPFTFTLPGFETAELEPWRENGEQWRQPLEALRAEIGRRRAAGAQRIGLMGFSAGGHLAGLAALSPGAAPDETVQFAVLGYAITSMETETYRPARLILLGEDASPRLRRSTSLDSLVAPQSPPFFVWHTAEDPYVLPEHTYRFASALAASRVPHAVHVFAHGPHSLGLAQDAGDAAIWTTLANAWIHEQASPPARRLQREAIPYTSHDWPPDGA
jgi:dienelactone hydrolase